MIFRQLVDAESKTLTYILGDPWSREGVIIDPVKENLERDTAFIRELGLQLVFSIETHVHADHVSAGAILRQKTGCKLIASKLSGVANADRLIDDGDAIKFGLQALEARATPGHTAGCTSFVSATMPHVFTGDALLIRGCGRTDFQGGDSRTLFRSIRDKLFSLDDETLVYPAHDYKGRTVSSIREEKLYNPRLGRGKSETDFVDIMAALQLAYPRHLDRAVPANLESGLEADDVEMTQTAKPLEFPIVRTPLGAPNLSPLWVAENMRGVRLVDVRQHEELCGADGRIAGSIHVPMEAIGHAVSDWSTDEMVVVYCRSGGRSDKVATELEGAGFRLVASMTGGILKWSGLGFPVDGGTQG